MERCQSGRLCRFRKAVSAQADRGFESSPLRQNLMKSKIWAITKKVLWVFLAVFFILFSKVLIEIQIFPNHLKPKLTQNLIVLGAQIEGDQPGIFLKARLDKAVLRFNQGGINYIIVSGGRNNHEQLSEAVVMKEYLLNQGIPQNQILIEDHSKNTRENIVNSKKIIDEMGLKNIGIVSNDFHLRRAGIFAERQGISPSYFGVYIKEHRSLEWLYTMREVLASINYGLIF